MNGHGLASLELPSGRSGIPVVMEARRSLSRPIQHCIDLQQAPAVLLAQCPGKRGHAGLGWPNKYGIHAVRAVDAVRIDRCVHLLWRIWLLCDGLKRQELLGGTRFQGFSLGIRLRRRLLLLFLPFGRLGRFRLLFPRFANLDNSTGNLLPHAIARLPERHLCCATVVAIVVCESPLLGQVLLIEFGAENLDGIVGGVDEPELLGASLAIRHDRAKRVAQAGPDLQAENISATCHNDRLPALVVTHSDLQRACEDLRRIGCKGRSEHLPLPRLQNSAGRSQVKGRFGRSADVALGLRVGPLDGDGFRVLEHQHHALPMTDDDAAEVDELGRENQVRQDEVCHELNFVVRSTPHRQIPLKLHRSFRFVTPARGGDLEQTALAGLERLDGVRFHQEAILSQELLVQEKRDRFRTAVVDVDFPGADLSQRDVAEIANIMRCCYWRRVDSVTPAPVVGADGRNALHGQGRRWMCSR
mmetsp:Transcript_59041/g.138143  ORF Transcript_59041/g.138143 Transcript_59041/m.138143 type:complete len:472 (-) Transcript_59041:317-1732(-)